MRTLIKGGTVYDGTGAPPQNADVLICGDTIEAIGPDLSAGDARVIDATGMAVTPGFIDMHRHCDIAVLADPAFGAIELAQGITATVAGNCGLAPVPSRPHSRDEMYTLLTPVTGPMPPHVHYETYAGYAEALRSASLPLHVGFFAGTGAIRAAVKGFADAPLTQADIQAAQALVEEAIAAGALGITTGLMYPPECYTTAAELTAMLRPMARIDGLLSCHLRGEGDSLVPSVREIIQVAADAGLRLNISHFKASGKRNWQCRIFEAIEVIEAARARGQAVTVDFYPYDGGSTTLQSLLPPCLLEGDQRAALQRLATPAGKRAAREAVYRQHPGWDNAVLAIGWERVLVSSTTLPQHAAYEGHDMASLAASLGMDDPCDLMCDLLAAEEGRVGIISLSMDMRDIEAIARLPYAAVISDALYAGGSNPHPRLYGALPKALRVFAREKGIWTYEEASHRMTGMPARRLGLRRQGLLSPGYRADVCVFDPAMFCDHATYADSKRPATGMHTVLVGGHPAWTDGGRAPGAHGTQLRA